MLTKVVLSSVGRVAATDVNAAAGKYRFSRLISNVEKWAHSSLTPAVPTSVPVGAHR